MSSKPIVFDSFEAFLDWERCQEARHELARGEPVAMLGENEAHAMVLGNVYAALREQLRGGPFHPFTGDIIVKTGHRQGRRPDISVDRGPRHPQNRSLHTPTALFEILSPETRRADFAEKLWDYDALPSVTHYVLFEPETPRAYLYSRGADGSFRLRPQEIKGLGGAVDLPSLGISLALADAYRDVAVREDLDPWAPPSTASHGER